MSNYPSTFRTRAHLARSLLRKVYIAHNRNTATDIRVPCMAENDMNHRFCWNCYNFEDRRDIDGVVLCTKGHSPGTICEEFVERDDCSMGIRLNGHFCWNCSSFEDRKGIDGAILCARGHYPEGNCDEFLDKNHRLVEIANNHRQERVFVKAILMADMNPINHSTSMKNLLSRIEKFNTRNGRAR